MPCYHGGVSRLLGLACVALLGSAAVLRATERFDMRFGEHLGIGDLRLVGGRATRQVEFPWPTDWRPQPGAELRLRFEHSPALDGERSFLAVSLNHGVLRSLRLDAQNAGPTDLVVPLAPEMLLEENQLVISVEQFGAAGATEAQWTLVRSSSLLSIPFERRRVERGLADLPEPILRRRSFEPRRLTLLVPTQPSYATLEATARTVASLTARVAPAPVTLVFVRSLREVETPAVAVGTPREQPALRELGAIGEDAAKPSPSTGVVALYLEAGPNAQPLLAVTGQEPGAVAKAALGLFSAPGRKGSRLLLVPVAPTPKPALRRVWRRFIPPGNGFTIDEAGDSRAELAVTADLPARVRMKAPPDARFLPYGHRATLVFEALPGLASDAKADLEVYWNDVLLRLLPMEQRAGARTFTLSVPIPASALKAENVLTVAWNGRSGATGPFVTLRGDSSLFLPREYMADLPDLALLPSGFYPFSLHADLADAVVGVPEGEEAVPALCEFAALLGRLLPTEQFLFKVAPASQALAASGQNVILLEAGDGPSSVPLPDLKLLTRGESLRRLPLVQEVEYPPGGTRYLLRIRAQTPSLLRVAARSLGEPAVWQGLSGDTAFLAAEGPQAFRVGTHRRIAEISYLTRLKAWLREHWFGLPLILAAASALLWMGLRLVLAHHRALGLPDRSPGPYGARAT
jgi:Bacterial cellulose synthase subunit